MTYLWCTPSTVTYTFFSIGALTPPPLTGYRSVAGALAQAIAELTVWLSANPDGPIHQPRSGHGDWFTDAAATTGFEVYAMHSVGRLTFGVLRSALQSLQQFMEWSKLANGGYNKGDGPMAFQINDGQWGEVGMGYVGYTGWPGHGCVYEVVGGKASDCKTFIKKKIADAGL